MFPPLKQPLAFPMVRTAQLLCSNVKITFVSSYLGYVMVMTTVAMDLMKNVTCAVRQRNGVLGSGGVWQNSNASYVERVILEGSCTTF